MSQTITQAMILAAGFGTRLRPITDTVPKAMAMVDGKPLLDYAMGHAVSAGARKIIVNTHYLPQVIEQHLQRRPVTISHETEILETGGGVKNVITQFDDKEFYVINADSLWLDGANPLLNQLAKKWDSGKMDALLALIPNKGQYPDLQGDFDLSPDGRLQRHGQSKPLPYHFMGVQILHPRLFDKSPTGRFSLNILYDQAEGQHRLYGHIAEGIEWFHISTPQDLQKTNVYFADKNQIAP
ncbi:MAG: nucleotidyltransferase family protein [Alphaproteobacteria bacterium]|nr:MAG: nucleotidyltransferase family protein [Alphaproteobacteria bacterium]